MEKLTDYVKWVASNTGIELDDKDLSMLTIELINDYTHNASLKKLQDRIVEVNNSKRFKA